MVSDLGVVWCEDKEVPGFVNFPTWRGQGWTLPQALCKGCLQRQSREWRGHGTGGPSREALQSGPPGARSEAHLRLLCFIAHRLVHPFLDVGCHSGRATHPTPLSMFEGHASPCRQHPGAPGSVIFPGRERQGWGSVKLGAPPASQLTATVRVHAEAGPDFKPSPECLAYGSWKSSFKSSPSQLPSAFLLLPLLPLWGQRTTWRQWLWSVPTPCH